MKNKRLIWIILLVLGSIPFVVALIYGIFSAINGFSGLCFCPNYYGFTAFFDSILLFSFVYYPAYIIGIILIVLSIIKIVKK